MIDRLARLPWFTIGWLALCVSLAVAWYLYVE